jgi:hypothetical protein
MLAILRLVTMRSKLFSSFSSFHIIRAAVLVLAGASLVATASAMSLRELRALEKSNKQGIHYAKYYLVGVMEGALEAHAHGVRNGAKPSICLNSRRLEPHMAKSLYDTERKRNEDLYEADMPVQLVMANALATVYACLD